MNVTNNLESPSSACHDSTTGSSNSVKVTDDVCLDDDEGDENAKIFPQRLMEILTNPNNQDSIAWLPHGKAFIIVNRQKFAERVLPHYFRKTKYTSFTRKLNRWNFSRVTRGPELGAYYHEFFKRGSEALCTQMYCKNERAKFAVTGREGKNERAAVDNEEPTPPVAQPLKVPTPPAAVQSVNEPVRRMSVSQMLQLNNMMAKPFMPTMDPAVQTRMLLHGGMAMGNQDPMTNSIIESAMRALHQGNNAAQHVRLQQANQDSAGAAFLRMQRIAAMQQQQAPYQQRPLNYYRASAA